MWAPFSCKSSHRSVRWSGRSRPPQSLAVIGACACVRLGSGIRCIVFDLAFQSLCMSGFSPLLTGSTGRRTKLRGRSWTARRGRSGTSIGRWWVRSERHGIRERRVRWCNGRQTDRVWCNVSILKKQQAWLHALLSGEGRDRFGRGWRLASRKNETASYRVRGTRAEQTCWGNGAIWPRNTHTHSVLCLLLLPQPGCVNTTEMDIRKCRRERNPHRVKKVSGG